MQRLRSWFKLALLTPSTEGKCYLIPAYIYTLTHTHTHTIHRHLVHLSIMRHTGHQNQKTAEGKSRGIRQNV